MNRCPNCNFENTPASTYCERCGAPLAPSSSPLEPTYGTPSEDSIPIPPPPPGYAEALPPTLYQYPSSAIRQQRRQHKRTIGGTILSSLLYLWGAFCFSFGFAGGVLQGTSNEIVALTFIGFCIAGLIFLIPLLLYRRRFFASAYSG